MAAKKVRRLSLAGVLVAVAVVGSTLAVPVLGSRCVPVQHMVNVVSAVMLGPVYAVGVAFVASIIRNLMGLGTLLAFPGSMCGALFAGLVYYRSRSLNLTLFAEIIGTGIFGGLLAYPIAILFMGKAAGDIAFYTYVVPFLISTVAGSIIAGILLRGLQRGGIIK